MTSVGTGYDLSNSVFSPDGRNFQVEYAGKAVENGSTTVGLKFKDGVVFAVEKTITNKLLVPGRNRKIQTIDRHVGCCYSGLIPDGKHLVNRGREEASSFKKTYGKSIPLYALSERLSQYVQAYTLYNSVRPFGIAAIFGGVLKSENGGDDKPQLYMLEPNGSCFGYKGIASGKGRQTARSEIEKLISAEDFDIENFSAQDAVKQAAKIIYLAHEDNKDKDFELELSWCSLSETDGLHKFVPKELYDEAVEYAKEETGLGEDEDEDSEDNDEEMDE